MSEREREREREKERERGRERERERAREIKRARERANLELWFFARSAKITHSTFFESLQKSNIINCKGPIIEYLS